MFPFSPFGANRHQLSYPNTLPLFCAEPSNPAPRTLSLYRDEKRDIDILPYDKDNKLDSKEINLIIDRARDEYDIILLDTAPVLKSYITEQVFLKTDILALVVNGNMTKYNEINKTLEIIEKLNVKSMTLVLNWLGKIK